MLRLMVIFLVMLIPLRGFSAELMAVQMAHSQAIVDMTSDDLLLAEMPDDCPMLAQQASETQEPHGLSKSKVGCQTCQLCMSLAPMSFAKIPLLSYECQPLPSAASTCFTSAELARQVKPPIL